MDNKISVQTEPDQSIPSQIDDLHKKNAENLGILFNNIVELSKDVKRINFETKGDARGSLVAIEGNKNIPFDIKRVYYIFDTLSGVVRGKHAHKNLKQILICTRGSCKVLIESASEKRIEELNDPSVGLYIEDLVWHEMYDFSPDCVLMVLADKHYNEEDYIRDYNQFEKYKNKLD